MDQHESNIHSFIVRVWLEEITSEAGEAAWRGHITHVASGKRRYLQELDAIAAFIAPYIEQMAVNLAPRRQLWRRLGKVVRRR
jgi:hypothetical protein